MYKRISTIALLAAIAAATLTASLTLPAAEKDAAAAPKADAAPAAEAAAAKSDRVPFHGKLGAVDKQAMTVTIEGKEKKRVIHVTSHTKITKAGKPATLEDAVVGEPVAGQLTKKDGKEEASSLRLGARPEATEKPKRKKKEK